ncbi:hypothetical protein, partial [Lentibacillus halophilus]
FFFYSLYELGEDLHPLRKKYDRSGYQAACKKSSIYSWVWMKVPAIFLIVLIQNKEAKTVTEG